MQEDCEILISLFAVDVKDAIEQCKNIICSVSNFNTFQDFEEYHKQHSHISTCQKEWSNPRMSIHCSDCSTSDTSCLCLECFLNGNHEGHNYIIKPNVVGNCDCGDVSLLKKQGFCKNHQGIEEGSNPEDYLPENLRTTLKDYVFKAAFTAIINQIENQEDCINSIIIIMFISIFLRFGDGFRRLIAISLTENIDFKYLMRNIVKYDIQFNKSLQKLCGKLVNDFVFKNNFSRIAYEIIIDDIFPADFDALIGIRSNQNYYIWNSFWFHSFSHQIMQYNIINYKWDWVSFIINLSKLLKRFFSFLNNPRYNSQFPHAIAEIIYPIAGCSEIQPNEQTQLLFDKLFTEVLNCGTSDSDVNNTIIPASFKDDIDEIHYYAIFHFDLHFYSLLRCFKNKPNLKVDSFIDELDDKFNISPIYSIDENENENDNYQFVYSYFNNTENDEIKKDYPSYYYRSFHNGSSLFFANPLFESFIIIFRQDNLCRVKIARFLSLERYQNLRIRLGISALKSLLAMVCYHESIVPKNNFALGVYIRHFVNNFSVAASGIPLYIPVLQLLIGLECNKLKNKQINKKLTNDDDKKTSIVDDDKKSLDDENDDDFIYGSSDGDAVCDGENDEEFGLKEYFAYEMAREFGIFDDFTKEDYNDENIIEQQKQMIFAFLYYSILIVIDRDLFNYDDETFIKEHLIFVLKQKSMTFDELSESFHHQSLSKDNKIQVLSKILSVISTPSKNKTTESTSNPNLLGSENEEIKYTLNENIEWKTITAINALNTQKLLLNNEISKNEENLLKIQNFESEKTFFFHSNNDNDEIDSSDLYIHLKEFLFTPTVFAIVYHTLRTNAGLDSPNVEINDHLAMNIILLISRFIKEEEENNNNKNKNLKCSFDESSVINYNEIPELISILKKLVFNYQFDSNKNVFIQNTLINIDNFHKLLKVKIAFGLNEPKSIIDLLLSKGKIGHKVLDQLSIKIDGIKTDKSIDNQDQKQIMKQRARKIKEDIMIHFKGLISNFNIDEDENEKDQIDESQNSEQIEKDTCSICSINKPNEILSYPIFIYYTKYPFIFDKPVSFLNKDGNENEIVFDEIDKEKAEEEKRIEDENIKIQNSTIANLNDLWTEYPLKTRNNLIAFLQKEVQTRTARNGRRIAHTKNEIRSPNAIQYNMRNYLINVNEENQNNNNNRNENENENEINSDNENQNENERNNLEENENERENLGENEINSDNDNNNENENERENLDENENERENLDENENENERENLDENEIINLRGENNNDDDGENESDLENDIDIEYIQKKDNDNKDKYPGTSFIIQFGICQHFVHPECVHRKCFKCPIDRSMKNGFLPCLDEFSENFPLKDHPDEINVLTIPFEVVLSIAMFINNLYGLIMIYDKHKCDIFVELIKSMSGLISTYEIRLRNLPYCLDSKKTKILSRNLFLNTWYGYRILGKPKMLDIFRQRKILADSYLPIDIDPKLTLFQKFIKKLIECDEIECNKFDAFRKIVSEFVNLPEFNPELIASSSGNIKRKKKELCLFLRRVCLAEYFLLGNPNSTKKVEWDDILSPQALLNQYNIDFLQIGEDEFYFKPFIFAKLPKQFIHFYLKPYCFPVDLTQDYIYYRLLNYKYYLEKFDDFDDVDDNSKSNLSEEEEKSILQNQLTIFGDQSTSKETYMLLTTFCVKKSPTILLYIGKDASKIILTYQGYKVVLKPFYVDKNGNPDIGYDRNQPLFLREEKLEKFVDEILSGDFTNYLEPLIKLI